MHIKNVLKNNYSNFYSVWKQMLDANKCFQKTNVDFHFHNLVVVLVALYLCILLVSFYDIM